jgi:hypothetical protein
MVLKRLVTFIVIIAITGLAGQGICSLPRGCAEILQNLDRARFTELQLESAVTELRPTQFDYGVPKIRYVVKKLSEADIDTVKQYLIEHPIPIVQGGDGLYVVDRHHTLRALHEVLPNLRERFPDQIESLNIRLVKVAAYRHLRGTPLLRRLEREQLLYPLRKGERLELDELPSQISELKKDYFRGMVWLLNKGGLLSDDATPFRDFQWANKLRELAEPDYETNWTRKEVKFWVRKVRGEYDEFEGFPGFVTNQDELPNVERIMEKLDKYLVDMD